MSRRTFDRNVRRQMREEENLTSPLFPDAINQEHFSAPSPQSNNMECFTPGISENDSPTSNFSFSFSSPTQTESMGISNDEVYMDTDTQINDSPSFADDLMSYMTLFAVPGRQMSFLLKLLRDHQVPDTPDSVYQLTKDAHKIYNKYNIDEEVCYMSIKDNLEFLVQEAQFVNADAHEINLKFNVDGFPLFKSSKVSVWPILCQFLSKTCNYKKPMPVAVFSGIGKPNMKPLLKKLSAEIQELKNTNCVINNVSIMIKNVMFVCDAPARALVMECKHHSGYSSCNVCNIHGVYSNGSVSFPYGEEATLRSTERYKRKEEDNQHGLSPLVDVVDFVWGFPPEYMHSILLGSFKRLVSFFLYGKKGERFNCKIRAADVLQINELIRSMRVFVPSDFQRKMRDLSHFEYFKATEFRQLLLYFGPHIFRLFLSTEYYELFCSLHFAVYTMCSDDSKELVEVAQFCLDLFLKKYEQFFGVQNQTYNNHVIRHLPKFVEKFGSLDNFSSFPFESYLHKIKMRVRGSRVVTTQTVRNMILLRNLFKNVPTPSSTISNKPPNNCVKTICGKIVLVKKVYDGKVDGTQLAFNEDVYKEPYPSSTHKIGYYKETVLEVRGAFVAKKCFSFMFGASFFIAPFCSSNLYCS